MHTQKPVIFLAFDRVQSTRAHHLRNLSKELSSIRQSLQKIINDDLCEFVERTEPVSAR